MSTIVLLERLHVALALISGLGFALRGFVVRILDRPLAGPLVRVGPHLIDTLLLMSGIGLWFHFRYSPVDSAWLGLKLALVVVYVLLGVAALRSKRRDRGVLAYLAALLVFLAIALLALSKPF
ncbi:SirB2 family protein [Halomonas denitrificans]|nr:SirB2 family protein [Halomonas denitrificans]